MILQDPPWYGFPASFLAALFIICAPVNFSTWSLCSSKPFYMLFLPPGSLSLPCQDWQLALILQILVWCVSSDRMGCAVVTNSLQISIAYNNRNLFLTHPAWRALFIIVALGPELLDTPLILWPMETNVWHTLALKASALGWHPSFLLTFHCSKQVIQPHRTWQKMGKCISMGRNKNQNTSERTSWLPH